jgi:hypothetical protein
MQVRTIEGSVIAEVDGTFEDCYTVAMHFWAIAGEEGVHMDGLQITDDGDEDGPAKVVLTIDYTTHER